MTKNTINERFIFLVNYLISEKIARNKSEIAQTCDIKVSKFSEILNKRMNAGIDLIAKFCSNYRISVEWIVFGLGKMFLEDQAVEAPAEDCLQQGIPLISLDDLAMLPEFDSSAIHFADCERYIIPEFEGKGIEFLIKVSGSSMFPKYRSGDILACKRIADILFFQWGKIHVIDSSQGILIKRIFEDKTNPEDIILVSDNKEKYPPFSFPKSDIRRLSIVLGGIRLE